MVNRSKKKRLFLLLLLYAAVIFLFRIWYIREINVPVIRNDEYGYWSHAAWFSGHDWSDVLSAHMNWYSYGYSLLLTPLFWFSHNLHVMYKAAILGNGIFGILSFYLCLSCARALFPKIETWVLATVSFMVMMYSSYLTQGAIAWSETFLYLLVWLLFRLFLHFERRPRTGSALLLSLCMGACYITHNRTIGILTAYLLIVLFLRLTDTIGWKLFFALLLPLMCILFVNTDIKTYLCMVEGFGLKPKNGMGAQKEHLLSLLTPEGWQNLIHALGGQFWGLMTSTFGLLFWGLAACGTRTVRALRTKKADRHTAFYLFVLLASIGTFLISAISLIDPSSITNMHADTDLSYFFYTRYNECVIGMLLLLGFWELYSRKKDKKFLLLTAGAALLYAAACGLLQDSLQQVEDTWHYRPFCAAGIGFYRLFSKTFSMRCCVLIAAAGFLILVLLLAIDQKHLRRVRLTAACLLLTAVFIPTGLYSAKSGTILSQRGKVSCGNLAMYGQLKKVVGKQDVYCTLDDTKNYRIAYELQVNLIDTHVYSITLEDLPVLEDNYFICCSNGDLDHIDGTDYYLLAQSNAYTVLVKGDALAREIAPYTEQELQNLNEIRNP